MEPGNEAFAVDCAAGFRLALNFPSIGDKRFFTDKAFASDNALSPTQSFANADRAFIARRRRTGKRIGEERWSVVMKRWLISTMLYVASMLPQTVEAFVEDPYITPAHPAPDRPIFVNVYMGGCHGSLDAVDGAELQVIAPGQLRLITNGIALDPGHPFCKGRLSPTVSV